MRISLSRSVTKARSLTVVVLALIVCSNLAFTGGMGNNLPSELEKEQVKKVND